MNFLQCLALLVIVIKPFTCEIGRVIYSFSGKYIYANSNRSPRNSVVCNRSANKLVTGSIKVILLIYLSLAIGVSAPMYKLFISHEKEMILPVIFPFIDPDTDHGFYINLASQYISCLSGFVILPGCELVLCALKYSFTAYAAVVANEILEFGLELEDDEEFSQSKTFEFRNIIVKILDYNRLKCYINHCLNDEWNLIP